MAIKGAAVTVTYYALDTGNTTYKTGDSANHTLKVVADGTQGSVSASPAEIDSTNNPGLYKVTVAAGENSGNHMTLHGKSATSDVVIIPVQWENVVNLTHIVGAAVNTNSAQLGTNVVTIEGGEASDQIRDSVVNDNTKFAGADIAAILADTGTDGVVLANDAITSAKFDESTAFPLKATDSGSTYIMRTGADGDTGETLSDQIDDIDSDIQDVGAKVQAQLTAAGYEAGDMNFVLFCTYDETITGLTIPSNWSKLYYSVKDNDGDTENEAVLRIVVTNGGAAGDGLLRIGGQSPTDAGLTAASASLTASQANGTLGVYVADEALSILTASTSRKYDVVVIEDDGTKFQLAEDDATFSSTRTRALS